MNILRAKNPRIFFILGVVVIAIVIFFVHDFYQHNHADSTVGSAAVLESVLAAAQNTTDTEALTLLIARTDTQKSLGLGGRDSLPADEGMLFIFDSPGIYAFWMKDTRFPLDIIWLDQNFSITYIARDISTSTYPEAFSPSVPSLYVLETNAGYVRRNNLKVGDSLDFIKKISAKL